MSRRQGKRQGKEGAGKAKQEKAKLLKLATYFVCRPGDEPDLFDGRDTGLPKLSDGLTSGSYSNYIHCVSCKLLVALII